MLPPLYFDTATILGLIAAVATFAAGAVAPALALVARSAVAAFGAVRARRERR